MSETIFIDGLSAYAPNEKAPDFVKASISIDPIRFAEFMRKNPQYINDKGYIRADIKVSKGGKYYIAVNTFGMPEPETQEIPPAPPREKTQAEISHAEAVAEYGEAHDEIPL
jgi:hypothetical protein